MRKIFYPSLFGFLLWYMQMIPDSITLNNIKNNEPFNSLLITIDYFLYNHRFIIGLISSLSIVFFSLKDSVWILRKSFHDIIHNQLKDILEKVFDNKYHKIRITVFKKASYSETLLHYLYHTLILNLFNISNSMFFSKFPTNFCDHLIIFERLGTPKEKVLTTTFSIDDNKETIEGVVGRAWKDQKQVKIDLPDITAIENLKNIKNENTLTDPQKKIIREYMDKGNIFSFKKLQSIHRYSISLWAEIIYDASNDPWGIIIIDSSDSKLINKTKEKEIQKYIKEIQRTIVRNYKEM